MRATHRRCGRTEIFKKGLLDCSPSSSAPKSLQPISSYMLQVRLDIRSQVKTWSQKTGIAWSQVRLDIRTRTDGAARRVCILNKTRRLFFPTAILFTDSVEDIQENAPNDLIRTDWGEAYHSHVFVLFLSFLCEDATTEQTDRSPHDAHVKTVLVMQSTLPKGVQNAWKQYTDKGISTCETRIIAIVEAFMPEVLSKLSQVTKIRFIGFIPQRPNWTTTLLSIKHRKETKQQDIQYWQNGQRFWVRDLPTLYTHSL